MTDVFAVLEELMRLFKGFQKQKRDEVVVLFERTIIERFLYWSEEIKNL